MSDQHVKDLLQAAVSSVAPDRLDVDAMVRGGRRRRRARTVATLGVAATVVAVVAVAVMTLRPHGQDVVTPTGPTGSTGVAVTLPTSQWRDGDPGMSALLIVTLSLTAEGCIVGGTDAGATALIWPAGYTAERFDGVAVVRDPSHRIVAQTGQEVRLGGGYGSAASGRCIDGYAAAWTIEQDPPFVTGSTATPGIVTVPDLAGLSEAAARAALAGVGLTVGAVTTESSAGAPARTVIAFDPAAGSAVAAGSSVRLAVSAAAGPSGSAAAGLRGRAVQNTDCAWSARLRLDFVPGQVIRYLVCPIPVDAAASPAGPPVEVSPAQAARFAAIDAALRLPDDTSPIDVCPTKPEPVRAVLAVTTTGIWSVHLPLDTCAVVLPAVSRVLDAG